MKKKVFRERYYGTNKVEIKAIKSEETKVIEKNKTRGKRNVKSSK